MEPPSRPAISIHNQTAVRAPRAAITRAIEVALQRHGRGHEAVAVALVDDGEMRRLNREFRHVDSATDVLTFPSCDVPGAPLGDIAICIDYALRQARARGVSLTTETAYLAIHGVLHLLGFDDETPEDQRAMVAEMNRLATAAGFAPDENWASILHAGAA